MRRAAPTSTVTAVTAVTLAVLATLAAGAARAQSPAAPPGRPPATGARGAAIIPGDGRSPEQLRAEVLERMRALRTWRIVDALKLDQATSARLFPILARYDDREMALATERRDVARLLRAEVDASKPDDARLSAAITRLLAIRERQRAMEDERVKELRKVLTPVQQAKLMLLLPRLEHEFARRIQQAANEQRGLTGEGGGP
jgi:Spy/CpxP family protein refolding chaperone